MKTSSEKYWRVIYTRSNHEKTIVRQLGVLGIETYLPLLNEQRKWSDRNKWIERPLFPNYVFVKIDESESEKLTFAKGYVYTIFHSGKPALIDEQQIYSIKALIETKTFFRVKTQSLLIGMPVQVVKGPLKGICGTLVNVKGKNNLSVFVEVFNTSLLVELDINDVVVN